MTVVEAWDDRDGGSTGTMDRLVSGGEMETLVIDIDKDFNMGIEAGR